MLRHQRQKLADGSATARAIDYSLKRWSALVRSSDDGELPIDNNWVGNRIRPIALGRQNWLFAGNLRTGKRAAAVMSLLRSAKLNGHDPYGYLKDVLPRLPTQPANPIDGLPPNRWLPQDTSDRTGPPPPSRVGRTPTVANGHWADFRRTAPSALARSGQLHSYGNAIGDG